MVEEIEGVPSLRTDVQHVVFAVLDYLEEPLPREELPNYVFYVESSWYRETGETLTNAEFTPYLGGVLSDDVFSAIEEMRSDLSVSLSRTQRRSGVDRVVYCVEHGCTVTSPSLEMALRNLATVPRDVVTRWVRQSDAYELSSAGDPIPDKYLERVPPLEKPLLESGYDASRAPSHTY